jgi:uncharacterized protein YijF (DUF1287 family)
MRKLILLSLLLFTFLFSFAQSEKVIDHAIWQTTQDVTYDGRYIGIPYPNGDVPANIGVCTDVVIRAYRAINKDLQQLIHEDMLKAREAYNKRYKTKVLDTSIDHRRTQNMQTYFTRHGKKLPISKNGSDYKPGDLVFWDVAAGHVGIVIDKKVPGTNRYYVVHNIGSGPRKEDFLFGAPIVDHYRWFK